MKQPERSNEELCVLAKQGDRAAEEQLVRQNLGFVRAIASRLSLRMDLKNTLPFLEIEDLIQTGCIGLTITIQKFDPRRRMKFLMFAGKLVRETILDSLRELSSDLDCQLAFVGAPVIRLEEVVGEKDASRADAMPDERMLSPEVEAMLRELFAELDAALTQISDRERMFVLYHFGFLDRSKTETGRHTVTESAAHFHLSESRAKTILEQSLQHLRALMPQFYFSEGRRYDCPEVVNSLLRTLEDQRDRANRGSKPAKLTPKKPGEAEPQPYKEDDR